jgi:D-amino peptidase
MRVFIAIDLEGIAGVALEEQIEPGTGPYEDARRWMRQDLDAALAGCAAAGVDEVVVCDAHDRGSNLRPDRLPAGVTLASGSGPYSMLQGIGPGFDAALFVGYHAKAGTEAAVLEHTWAYKVFGVSIGALEVGEFGLGALLAGHFDVPAVYLSGDDKAVAEAGALVPGLVGTIVKRGASRTCAELRPLEEARESMRADVQRALSAPSLPAPLVWDGQPLRLTFTRAAFCDAAARLPGARRLDGRTLEFGADDYEQLYVKFLACLDLAASAT